MQKDYVHQTATVPILRKSQTQLDALKIWRNLHWEELELAVLSLTEISFNLCNKALDLHNKTAQKWLLAALDSKPPSTSPVCEKST